MAGVASAWGAAQPIGHGHPAGHRPPATGLRPSPSPGDRAEAYRFQFIGGREGPLGQENHPGGRNAKAVATTDTISASRLQEVRTPSRWAGLVAMLLNTRPVLQGGGDHAVVPFGRGRRRRLVTDQDSGCRSRAAFALRPNGASAGAWPSPVPVPLVDDRSPDGGY